MTEQDERAEDALMPQSFSFTGEESPGKRGAPVDPDEELDQLLRKQRVQDLQEVPAWAETLMSMQHNVSLQLAGLGKGLHGFENRLNQLESENMGQRMKEMEGQVQELVQVVRSLRQSTPQTAAPSAGEAFRQEDGPKMSAHPPPLSRPEHSHTMSPKKGSASSSPTNSAETDYCHIVAGGWPEDTRRQILQDDTWHICNKFGPAIKVERVVVFGSRANVSHIYLSQQAGDEAREIFYRLQQEHSRQFQSKVGGEPIWLSPSRTPERRAKNRCTREALNRLQRVLQPDKVETLEVDWARQIIWCKDKRVATGKMGDMRSSSQDRVVHTQVSAGKDGQEAGHYYVNITTLAALAEKNASDVEVLVQTSS